MGLLDKFKKTTKDEDVAVKVVKEEKKEKVTAEPVKTEKPVKAESKPAANKTVIKGKSLQAYRVLLKPIVTEKVTYLGSLNQYVFAVSKKMNKLEVKKAVRAVYNVDPVSVNILNFSGKHVRYGRISGKTKAHKKAIVTLKPGDKIELYEGV